MVQPASRIAVILIVIIIVVVFAAACCRDTSPSKQRGSHIVSVASASAATPASAVFSMQTFALGLAVGTALTIQVRDEQCAVLLTCCSQ